MPEFFINPTRDVVYRIEESGKKGTNNKRLWLQTRAALVDRPMKKAVNVETTFIDDEQYQLIQDAYGTMNDVGFREFLLRDCVDSVKKMYL